MVGDGAGLGGGEQGRAGADPEDAVIAGEKGKGALVPPELPLVVAPHATVPITLTSATILITADIGSLLLRGYGQTRSTVTAKQRECPPPLQLRRGKPR